MCPLLCNNCLCFDHVVNVSELVPHWITEVVKVLLKNMMILLNDTYAAYHNYLPYVLAADLLPLR